MIAKQLPTQFDKALSRTTSPKVWSFGRAGVGAKRQPCHDASQKGNPLGLVIQNHPHISMDMFRKTQSTKLTPAAQALKLGLSKFPPMGIGLFLKDQP